MPLHIFIRRILFFLAIISFLVIAPLVVLYAYGYRYDFDQKRITQVGMITIKSIPKTVNIFIDDQLRAKRTYARIRDLLPKNYVVKIQKNGYNSWEKKLEISPRKVTTIKHARLFLQKPKIKQLTNFGIDNYFISPDATKIVYTISSGDQAGLWLLNLASGDTSKLFPKSKEEFTKVSGKFSFSNVKWSPDSRKILAQYKTKSSQENTQSTNSSYHLIINISRPAEIIFLEDLFKLKMEKVKWNSNSNEIFCLNKNNLYRIRLDKKILFPALADNVLEFSLQNKNIWYISKTRINKKIKIQLIRKELANSEEEIVADLSNLGTQEFSEILVGKKRIALRLGKDKSLYILQQAQDDKEKLQKIADEIQKAIWDPLQNKLFYQNDYEISILRFVNEDLDIELEKPQSELITRYSEKIQDCLWYPDYQHIVFSVKNTIKIIELDGRDKRNVYEIGEIKAENQKIACGSKGRIIYFIDEKNKAENLYQARIY